MQCVFVQLIVIEYLLGQGVRGMDHTHMHVHVCAYTYIHVYGHMHMFTRAVYIHIYIYTDITGHCLVLSFKFYSFAYCNNSYNIN